MTSATSLVPIVDVDSPAIAVHETRLFQLGESIAALAAHLHAATYELLVLLRQFDEGVGWNGGFRSCAHWLHWRTGIDLGAAREKVRVSRALANLPLISAAMQRGAVSYAKVRALTRVATRENERQLLDAALAGTAAHVEQIVRAWRRVDRIEAAQMTEQRSRTRHVSMWVDEDGMLVIRGRLTPEVGACVQRALEAAAEQPYREPSHAANADRVIDEVTPGQRRADALGRLAECALTAGLDRGTAGDRYQVVIHVDSSALRSETASTGADAGQAVVELDDAATCVSAETCRRIACDASVVVMQHGVDGSVLDVGRRTRTIPPAIRRALAARDRHCRFPGCTARRCDGHHITHWADGGATRLPNLLLLCRLHHRAVHEGRFRVVRERDGTAVFFRPDGTRLDVSPAAPCRPQHTAPLSSTDDRGAAHVPAIGPPPVWNGEPLDVVWALDVLRQRR